MQREGLREHGASFTLLNTHTHTHTHSHTHTHMLRKAVLRLWEKRRAEERTARSLSKLHALVSCLNFSTANVSRCLLMWQHEDQVRAFIRVLYMCLHEARSVHFKCFSTASFTEVCFFLRCNSCKFFCWCEPHVTRMHTHTFTRTHAHGRCRGPVLLPGAAPHTQKWENRKRGESGWRSGGKTLVGECGNALDTLLAVRLVYFRV